MTAAAPRRSPGSGFGPVLVVAVVLLAGRLSGLLRDFILAPLFGAGVELDAYIAARTIPELLLTVFTAGGVSAGLIPLLSRWETADGGLSDEGARAISALVNWLLLLAVGAVVIGMAWADPLLGLTTPGLGPERQALAVRLLRTMLPILAVLTGTAVLSAYYNFRDHFALPAARALVINLTIIAATLLLAPSMGIEGVALGWLLGAGLQLVALLVPARSLRMPHRVTLAIEPIRQHAVLAAVLPILLAETLLYGRIMMERFFSAGLAVGELSHLTFANRIATAPVLIVGNAVSVAFLPRFAALQSHAARRRLSRVAARAGRFLAAGTVPFVVVAVLLPAPTVSLLLERGAFLAADALATARLLRIYAVALVAMSVLAVAVRLLYARGRASAAVAASVGGLITQGLVTVALLPRWQADAVAAGTGAGLIVSAAIALRWGLAELPSISRLQRAWLRAPSVAGIAMAVTVAVTWWGIGAAGGSTASLLPRYCLSVFAGAPTYLLALHVMGSPELRMLRARFDPRRAGRGPA